jgi:1,4-alpha-glucan branching enzyme
MKTKKESENHRMNSRDTAPGAVRVEFNHPTAEAVAVAGSFNDWHPEASHMVAVGDGRWLKELVLPPGTYEYLFWADGQWLPDPLAKKTVLNPFGGVNSVLEVPNNGDGIGHGSESSRRRR